MLPSRIRGISRYDSGRRGRKSANTFRSVTNVRRSFMFREYTPCQKKVLPEARSKPSRSMLRRRRTASSSGAKSSPTIATRRTCVKWLAASAM